MRNDRRIPLVIAGGGNPGVFGDAGIAPTEDVRLLGRVSDQELRALYENAMALIFPSITEGFGLPPVEAMFCGCPVIASAGGAVPEVCDGAALSVDPMDMEGWSTAMTRLTDDPDLRISLKRAGTQRSKAFTWRRAAETLLQHLADLPTD
jgi:glycosyltransferase involved in cell wall biosynthesis